MTKHLGFLMLAFFLIANINAQEAAIENYREKQIDLGLTAGTFPLLYTNIELSLPISKRHTETIIYEFKPLVGMITQNFLFIGDDEKTRIGFAGATLGLNAGKNDKYFDLNLGAAYVFFAEDNDFEPQVLPIISLAYKRVFDDLATRAGIGFPYGAFLSFYIKLKS